MKTNTLMKLNALRVMRTHMFGVAGIKFQVLYPVVASIGINVVNNLFMFKKTAQKLLHYQSMFRHIPISIRKGVVFNKDVNITPVFKSATIVIVGLVASHVFLPTFLRAILKSFSHTRLRNKLQATGLASHFNWEFLHTSIIIPIK